ncbi:hypothetical protein FMD71_00515 [Salmonella enterica subsp. enterica serovar Enteritidis]|nr:hypothetical protein [Salmonella enterica subsp. enterica serovar Enteritidis]HAC7084976.1 hypothetical protein [Salmonella enterica]
MIASLDELYHSELFFLPVMDENARLVGLEIIATFAAEDGAVRMPTELVAPRLSVEEQYCLFVEKLALLETCQHFFIQQRAEMISFEPFMHAIVAQISSSCESLMIAGIDNEAMFSRAAPLGFSAFQGGLWPPVPVSQLIKLVQR